MTSKLAMHSYTANYYYFMIISNGYGLTTQILLAPALLCMVLLALCQGPFPAFQCCTLKSGRAWYAKSHACHDDQSWRGMMRTKSRSMKVNKTGPFLCYLCLLSTLKAIEGSPFDSYIAVSLIICYLYVTSQVSFDPRDGLDLLSFSITWLHISGPPAVQYWKAWNG